MRRRRDGGDVVGGEDAGLQLADPISTGEEREAWILPQVSFELLLVEHGVIEEPEYRGLAP